MLVLIERCAAPSGGSSSMTISGRRIEQLTEGVVSVEWELPGVADETARVHLHVGDGTKPPVDFAFDERDGRLVGIQLVFQDELVREEHLFGGRLHCETGVPIADLTPWREEEQILDHVFTPTVAWEPLGTLAVRVARIAGLPTKECGVNGLRLVLDDRGLVLGFRLSGLGDLEIDAVARAAADGTTPDEQRSRGLPSSRFVAHRKSPRAALTDGRGAAALEHGVRRFRDCGPEPTRIYEGATAPKFSACRGPQVVISRVDPRRRVR